MVRRLVQAELSGILGVKMGDALAGREVNEAWALNGNFGATGERVTKPELIGPTYWSRLKRLPPDNTTAANFAGALRKVALQEKELLRES